MKLLRRTVLSGTAAALPVPFITAVPARAEAKQQSLVDSCLESAREVLGSKDFPDAAKLMTNTRGVLIIPELVQGGFILGAAGAVGC
jgi:SH3 domain-containing YSC84-like protein 1